MEPDWGKLLDTLVRVRWEMGAISLQVGYDSKRVLRVFGKVGVNLGLF